MNLPFKCSSIEIHLSLSKRIIGAPHFRSATESSLRGVCSNRILPSLLGCQNAELKNSRCIKEWEKKYSWMFAFWDFIHFLCMQSWHVEIWHVWQTVIIYVIMIWRVREREKYAHLQSSSHIRNVCCWHWCLSSFLQALASLSLISYLYHLCKWWFKSCMCDSYITSKLYICMLNRVNINKMGKGN